MASRTAPYRHSDGTNCYTKDCKTRLGTRGREIAMNSHNFNSALDEIGDKRRPVIGLDLDGVTVQYEKGFREFVSKKLNKDESEFPALTNYSTIKSGWPLKDEEEFRTLHAEAVTNGLYTSLEAIPGAAEALKRLANDGYKFRVITARLMRPGQHAEVVSQTAKSLDILGIPYKDISFTSEKTEINADVYVDDAPYNIDALRANGKPVVAFAQPYNKDYSGRAQNWNEAEAMIRKLAPIDSD